VADSYIEPDGSLALVIPAALTTGVAWKKTRQLIDTGYELNTVIASHEADRWNFSENTDLSEVLVIAHKRAGELADDHLTTFINLWVNPATIVEALGAATAIERAPPAEIGSPEDPKRGTASLSL